LPIYYPTETNENVMMKGFLDLVFEDVTMNRMVILDIKTSTNGWNKYQKADKTKTAQLVLYKKFFSKQYGYPIENIQVKYFILKRKLYEEVMFAQSRIQEFEPAAGSVTLKQIGNNFESFVKSAFNDDGSYRTDGVFEATAGEKNKNCKYCPFKDNHDLCVKAERLKS